MLPLALDTAVVWIDDHHAMNDTTVEVGPTTEWPYIEPETRVLIVCYVAKNDEGVFFDHLMFRRIPNIVRNSVVYTMPHKDCSMLEFALSLSEQDRNTSITFLRRGSSRHMHDSRHQSLSIRYTGEVFFRHGCNNNIQTFWGTTIPESDARACCWIHVLEMASLFFGHYLPMLPAGTALEAFRALTYEEAVAAHLSKPLFAAYSFGKFRMDIYHGEYVVRHAFVNLLHEIVSRDPKYRIDSLGGFTMPGMNARHCSGHYNENVRCFSEYRFAIVMENSRVDGYVSEKILHAFLNHAIPVYFGPKDIGLYLNPKAMVICDITDEEQEMLRHAHKTGYGGNADPLNVVQWASQLLQKSLQSCLREMLVLEFDSVAYIEKLMEHPLALRRIEDTDLDGYVTSCQTVRCLDRYNANFLAGYQTATALEKCNARTAVPVPSKTKRDIKSL